LGTGQAFITVLNEKGIPTETVVTHLAPPASVMGPLPATEYQQVLEGSDYYKKYKDTVDPKSAFEILSEKMEAAQKQQEAEATQKAEAKLERESSSRPVGRPRQEKSTFDQVMKSPVTKQIGRELVRGVFGMLFGTTRRRR
jgi:uncharacterized protein